MPDSKVIRISEVSATSQYLNRPLRSLDQLAIGQERLAKLRLEAERYASFQKLRDIVREFTSEDCLINHLSCEQTDKAWAALREAERF